MDIVLFLMHISIRTTRAQRTGCTMCGFGIHMEKRPHRFDRLREQEERRWIPVTERLPQNYISVLVYIPTAETLPMVHEAYIGDDGEWHSSVFYGIENEDVTHWMPMPKTPKEDA